MARSDRPEVVARLRLVLLRLERRIRQRSATGVTPSQFSALSTIDRHGPLRLGEVARREGISKSSVTRLIAKLEGLGHVERRTDPADGRGALVALSPSGVRLMAATRERADAYLSARLDALTDTEWQVLQDAVPVLEHLLVARREHA